MRTSEQRRETFERFRREKATVTPIRAAKEATTCPDVSEKNAPALQMQPGGKRWGYPLEFKMDVIRAVREQGMTVNDVARKFDVSYGTVNRWLDYYDLKRIPPKGANEYPINPQVKETAPVAEAQPAPATAPPGERREHIRDAIDLLKQAVDLLHIATRPKPPTQEPARHV